MRLGGPIFIDSPDPERWAKAVRAKRYRAAYCPVDASAGSEVIQAYAKAAAQADIVIAEVGAWSNPLSPDPSERSQALAHCQRQLALAEEIGAGCCVNIAGACGPVWDGPYPANLTRLTFDLIVEQTRAIIDAVQPRRTYYTLEPMPWIYPCDADDYLNLIRAIDRPRFAVHLDPVNMINNPQRFFTNGEFLRECFDKLGPYIKSIHAKDIRLTDAFTVHLDEVRPGLGDLDYRTFLTRANRLPANTPIMLEHLETEAEYDLAAEAVRAVANEIGVSL